MTSAPNQRICDRVLLGNEFLQGRFSYAGVISPFLPIHLKRVRALAEAYAE